MIRQTHTYAILEIPKDCWLFIRERLVEAGYQDQIHNHGDKEVVDMNGIALAPIEKEVPSGSKSLHDR